MKMLRNFLRGYRRCRYCERPVYKNGTCRVHPR